MAYCTITDVQLLNPKRTYDASSKPTLTQANSLIDRVAKEMDAILAGRKLTVPVTAPDALLDVLVQINATGAAALAEMGMFPEATGVGATPHGADLWRQYKVQMDWLKTGALPTGTGTGSEPRSFFEQHTTEPDADETWRKPKFGKNKEF